MAHHSGGIIAVIDPKSIIEEHTPLQSRKYLFLFVVIDYTSRANPLIDKITRFKFDFYGCLT